MTNTTHGYWGSTTPTDLSRRRKGMELIKLLGIISKHHREVIKPYEYESALQLLQDFWREVDMILSQEKR
jgi:hypothetical protein